MIRVNDFLADFEAHHAPPSNLKISDCAARAGLGSCPRTLDCVEPCLVSSLSLASYLANGQGSVKKSIATKRHQKHKMISFCFVLSVPFVAKVLVDNPSGFGKALVRSRSSLLQQSGGVSYASGRFRVDEASLRLAAAFQ